MIAFDLDGTTLQDDHETFSERLVSALTRAHEKGLWIIPSTGRPYGALPPALQDHPVWESYGVLSNGEQLRDLRTGEKLEELFLPDDIPGILYDYSKEFDLAIEMNVDGRIYLTQESYDREKACPELEFHVSEVLDVDGVIVDSLEPLLADKSNKYERVQIMCIPDWVRPIIFGRLVSRRLSTLTSWMGRAHMEVTHHDAHKGRGVETLCNMLGVDLSEVIAFGDADNDVSMLRMAGLGICPEGGWDEALAAADETTLPFDQDGVAAAIEKYILD